MKHCTKCGEMKSLDEFSIDKSRADGKQKQCKKCVRRYHSERRVRGRERESKRAYLSIPENRKRHNEKCKEWRAGNLLRHRLNSSNQHAKSRNHAPCTATIKELEAAFTGCCAICGAVGSMREFRIDHCHETGVLRGWLCDHCNLALGLLRDSAKNLFAAFEYLAHQPNGKDC